MLMESTPGSKNGGTPFPEEPFTFPYFANVGPSCISTLILPGLTIRLPVFLFPTPMILNLPSASIAPNASDVSTPPTHLDFYLLHPLSLLPFLLLRLVKALKKIARLIRRRRNKKRRRRRTKKGPSLQRHQMLDPHYQLLLIIL
jgi:hypothetical protein